MYPSNNIISLNKPRLCLFSFASSKNPIKGYYGSKAPLNPAHFALVIYSPQFHVAHSHVSCPRSRKLKNTTAAVMSLLFCSSKSNTKSPYASKQSLKRLHVLLQGVSFPKSTSYGPMSPVLSNELNLNILFLVRNAGYNAMFKMSTSVPMFFLSRFSQTLGERAMSQNSLLKIPHVLLRGLFGLKWYGKNFMSAAALNNSNINISTICLRYKILDILSFVQS